MFVSENDQQMHICVNWIESWLMLVHIYDTHTRSTLFVPSVSIILSATISLKICCQTKGVYPRPYPKTQDFNSINLVKIPQKFTYF